MNMHWKDWCWSWNSNTLATWCKELTHWKRLWCWERLKAEGEGDNRGWDGWMASPTQWAWVWASSGSGQGSLVCCIPRGHKVLDPTGLKWTELNLWLIKSQGCDSQTCWMNKELVYTLCPSVSSSSSLTSSSAHIMSIITLPKPLFFCAD